MKRQFRFRQSEEQQQQAGTTEQTQSQGPREFNSVEALLRHDALHTPLPPNIAHRLNDSIRAEPRPPRPWWKRLFGKSS